MAQLTIRERIQYFHDLKNEGFSSNEAAAIAKEEGNLTKGDKSAWTGFFAVYPDHEFREISDS